MYNSYSSVFTNICTVYVYHYKPPSIYNVRVLFCYFAVGRESVIGNETGIEEDTGEETIENKRGKVKRILIIKAALIRYSTKLNINRFKIFHLRI